MSGGESKIVDENLAAARGKTRVLDGVNVSARAR